MSVLECKNCLNIRIYLNIRTFVCVKFDFANIFGYSFVSVLECKILNRGYFLLAKK